MELVTGTWGFSNTRPSQVQKRLEQEDHNSRQQATVGSEGHTSPGRAIPERVGVLPSAQVPPKAILKPLKVFI